MGSASSWLAAEALRAQPATRDVRILMCPVAPWLLDGHPQQLGRLEAWTWSGDFDVQELLQLVAAARRGKPSCVVGGPRL